MGVETPFLDFVHAQRPDGVVVNASNFEAVPAPGKRTELYTDGGTPWLHFVISSFPFGEAMVDTLADLPRRAGPHGALVRRRHRTRGRQGPRRCRAADG